MDEISLYNRALSPAEIGAIYAAASAGRCKEPKITAQPQSQSALAGSNPTFAVSAAGFGVLHYQWQKGGVSLINGARINGVSTPTLMISGVQLTDAGSYSCLVTNAFGSVTSSNAVLTVNPAPCAPAAPGLISWWPGEDSTADAAGANNGVAAGYGAFGYAPGVVGQAFVFDGIHRDRVDLGNPANLQLQDFTIEVWIKRASPANISLDDNNQDGAVAGEGGIVFGYGRYGYGFGLLNNGQLILSKIDVDGILSTNVVADTNWHHVAVTKSGTTAAFYIDGAPASAPMSYTTTYTFDTSVAIGSRGDARGGTFWGMVDEPSVYGRALSSSEVQALYAAAATGKCPLPPSVLVQPANQTVVVGRAATFSALAGGTGPFTYRWQHNGTNLVDGGRIAGAATAALTISAALGSDGGAYRAVATNAAGPATSAEAVLSVVPILGWGYNYYGQATAPAEATNIVGLDAGWQHALALRADGTLVGWGYNESDLAPIPAEAVNIVAMAVGDYHNLVLRADGTVLAWGKNEAGESSVPANATNVVALAGGYSHSLALRADGTVTGWGDNTFGQVSIPAAATNVVAIAAGLDNCLALKADGSVVAWGIDQEGETDVPASATNVVAISAGATHCLALKSDGTIAAWGSSVFGKTTIPTNAINVTAISSGGWDNLAVLHDGTVTGWGYNYHGQAAPPSSATNPAAIFAGGEFSLAWLRDPSTGISPRFWQQPADRTVLGGDTIFLYPGINGMPPLRFQWCFNNSPMAGQTNRWVSLPNANPTQTGGYSVVVTNDFGAVTSVVATVTLPAIKITTQPTNVEAIMNSSVTLAATVAGTAPLVYRWQKDGQDLSDTNRVSGSASTALAITGIQPGDTGSYRLIVTNAYAAVTSDVAVLTVLLPTPLLNLDFGGGAQSVKTGLAAIGQSVADYWNYYTAGSPAVTNLLLADGSLTGFGVVVSNAPFYNVNDWTDPMLHDFIYLGQFGGSFNVSLFGLPPGTYDFYLYTAGGYYFPWLGSDFELVVGGVSQGHSVFYGFGPDAPPWQEGIHYGTFHNIRVSAPGQTVVVVVRGNSNEYPNIGGLQIGQFLTSAAPPVFWSQPISQYVPIGTNLLLSATGTGFPAPTQQWFFNGAPLTNSGRITGADGNSLTIAGAQFADTGDYYAVLTNSSGMTTSTVAHVVIGVPPALTLQPTNQTWIAGSTRLLAAQATGSDPLAYQWYLGSTRLTDNPRLSGTASNILSVSNVLAADAGTYTLVVTNLFGSLTSTAAVAVIVPPAFTAQPKGWSVPVGLPVVLSAGVSGTAPLSYQWRLNGTNVAGATSNALSFAALGPADFGDYQLVVTNFGGAVTNGIAQLTIGPVATWGSYSQIANSTLWPGPGLSNVIAIAGGWYYSLALREDGTLYAWGNNAVTSLPVGLSGIVGMAAGLNHVLAIRSDGSVVAWGSNSSGQTNVPAGLSNVVAVTAGVYYSAALRADGTVVVWGGSPRTGESNIPPSLIKVAAIDANWYQTLALRENGTVVGWGGSPVTPVPPYLHGVVGVSAGSSSGGLSLALLTNGTVAAWSGLGLATNIPLELTNLVAVEAAAISNDQGVSLITGVNLVLRSNGTVVAWGSSTGGITNVPPGLSNAVAIAGGATHALALVNDGRPLIVRPPVGGTFYTGGDLVLKAKAVGNEQLAFQWFKDGNPVPGGTGQTLALPSVQFTDAGSYRLVVSNALGVAQSLAVPVTIVESAPLLVSQPASGFAYYGSPFSVGASIVGSGPIQLTWLQNGVAVANGTNELAFSRALPQHGGAYQLIASNPFGSVTSSVAQITFSRVASWGAGPSLTNAPVDLGSALGVASGYFHALAIQSNRTVAAWGTAANGATNVPPGLSNVVAVSGGNYFSVALRSDGTVTTWGSGIASQTNVLAGLSNVVAISAGGNHALALRADGTVTAWGLNSSSQTNVPAGLSNVVAIAAGSVHSLALKDDGTIVGWGAYGQIPSYTNAVAIAAGYGHSLALQADGTMLRWTAKGGTTLPVGLTNVVAISAGGGYQGWSHSVALRADGTLVAWGDNNYAGQLMVPQDLLSATAISAGGGSTRAFLNDRSPAITVQPWDRRVAPGTNLMLGALAVGQPPLRYQWYCSGAPVPGATSNWLAFTNTHPAHSGGYQLVAMNDYGAVTSAVATLTVTVPAVRLTPLGLAANGFRFSFTSLAGVLYIVEFKDNLAAGTWMELERRFGIGGLEIVTDTSADGAARFYRVRALYAPSPMVSSVSWSGGAANFSFATVPGAVYVVQYKERLDDAIWLELSRQIGTAAPVVVSDPNPARPSRFYRVQVE